MQLEKSTEFIKGMDISSIKEVEEAGGKFYDHGVQKDVFDILKDYGTNYIRLRLWNNPYSDSGEPYGAGTNGMLTTIELARRAKNHGMKYLLDFQYSDFWADPGKQNIPKAWRNCTKEELVQKVYEYTREIIAILHTDGISPDMIQVGNELSNGLLWPYGKVPNYDTIAEFVNAGIRGVREVDSTVPIMLHLDNGGNNALYREWFDNFCKRGENFQIIGLSYYPFWHGSLEKLQENMNDIAVRYGKDLIIAEVSSGFTMEDYAFYEKLTPEERKGYATKPSLIEDLAYPMTPEGQAAFMKKVMDIIRKVPQNHGKGFFYWEPAWIPVPGVGWATEAALQYTGEKGPGGNEWANQALFDYDGNALPALETIRDYE